MSAQHEQLRSLLKSNLYVLYDETKIGVVRSLETNRSSKVKKNCCPELLKAILNTLLKGTFNATSLFSVIEMITK